ncbi:MAG: lipopolysaccharide heptosyltransferase II [candidate division Zixibacteria bacterium]|nr:lipopolysaccharide heptosyltransferase II [candidate division Zixibacteria bacterium]
MKLIVRAPNWVGDAVMALTTLDKIKSIMTCAETVTVMARKATSPLFKNHPDVDEIIKIDDKCNPFLGTKRSAGLIKAEKFDVGLILPPSLSAALIFKLGNVSKRFGYATDKRSLLLTRAIEEPAEAMHRVEKYIYLLEKISGKKIKSHNPTVYLSHDDISAGAEDLKQAGLNYEDKYIAIAPRAIGESRRWGSNKYGQLAVRLSEKYTVKVFLVGTANDSDTAEEIRAIAPDTIVNLCGQTSLMSAAAILSFAKLFVGNDSGLAHLAGGVKCPLVVLSGADNPQETSPMCDDKTVIIKDIDCISCVKNKCRNKGEEFMLCMKLITVDEVFDAASKRIKI